MSTIDSMLENHKAETWSDTVDDSDYVFDDPQVSKLERLESYIDYCFETYDIVSRTLDRDQITCYVADWGNRRGQERPNVAYEKRTFGQRVRRCHEYDKDNHYAIFMAEALIGIPPEDDKGVGWKRTVRHELGHAIDHQQRGRSDHGPCFKSVMKQFGEGNDGMSQHGYPPRYFR